MIDTHIHLDDTRYDAQREEIINSLASHGVRAVINTAAEYDGMMKGYELALHYDNVYCTLGCHPHDASTYNKKYEDTIIQLAPHNKVVAIGEIGLDYYYQLSEVQTQKEVFARQIILADRLQLPLTLHIRDAFGDLTDILAAHKQYLNHGVLLHCYSGSGEMARQLLTKYDCYFAFGGAITFKKNKKSDVCQYIPIERILTETDGPYLTPEPLRGQLNYPHYIGYVLEALSAIYGISYEQVQTQTELNAKRFFTKLK